MEPDEQLMQLDRAADRHYRECQEDLPRGDPDPYLIACPPWPDVRLHQPRAPEGGDREEALRRSARRRQDHHLYQDAGCRAAEEVQRGHQPAGLRPRLLPGLRQRASQVCRLTPEPVIFSPGMAHVYGTALRADGIPRGEWSECETRLIRTHQEDEHDVHVVNISPRLVAPSQRKHRPGAAQAKDTRGHQEESGRYRE